MGARLRSWWQQIKPYRVTILVVSIILVVAIALIFVEVIIYGTGFAGKTLWDWLQLLAALAIPVVVGFGAVWFTSRQGKVADAENKDNQHETALQSYIDKMSDLLLHEKLRESKPEDEVRKIARVRTLSLLPRLDPIRKGSVIQFLYDSALIHEGKHVIDLDGADLSNAYLREANLNGVNLSGTNLNHADMTGAYLHFAKLNLASLHTVCLHKASLSRADMAGAKLIAADLSDAYLEKANLSKADMTGAYFSGANLDRANLGGAFVDVKRLEDKAKSLKGETMPDVSIHP